MRNDGVDSGQEGGEDAGQGTTGECPAMKGKELMVGKETAVPLPKPSRGKVEVGVTFRSTERGIQWGLGKERGGRLFR